MKEKYKWVGPGFVLIFSFFSALRSEKYLLAFYVVLGVAALGKTIWGIRKHLKAIKMENDIK